MGSLIDSVSHTIRTLGPPPESRRPIVARTVPLGWKTHRVAINNPILGIPQTATGLSDPTPRAMIPLEAAKSPVRLHVFCPLLPVTRTESAAGWMRAGDTAAHCVRFSYLRGSSLLPMLASDFLGSGDLRRLWRWMESASMNAQLSHVTCHG